jgi:hypothetical protein
MRKDSVNVGVMEMTFELIHTWPMRNIFKVWGFNYDTYEERLNLGCDAIWLLQKRTFQKNVSLPSSGLNNQQTKNTLEVVSNYSTLKMEEIRSSETPFLLKPHGATSQRTTFFLRDTVCEQGNRAELSGYIKKFKVDRKKTPWPLVRERTIPTERPPLVDEI